MPGAIDRDFYKEVADRLPSSRLIFLNYGYADVSPTSSQWMAPGDERYKYHLSLIKHVMGGVELAGRTVLEVGSGRGGNCYYLTRYTQAKKIYGIDLCESNVQFCRVALNLCNCIFLRANAEQIPFRSETFDVVLNLESSHCYQDFGQFLAEVHRVLKPGGVFCYADVWFLKFSELDWENRRKLLDAIPFDLLLEEDISEPVFRALNSGDGFVENIREMISETNREFVEGLVSGLKLVRLTLAADKSSYLLWRFRKP